MKKTIYYRNTLGQGAEQKRPVRLGKNGKPRYPSNKAVPNKSLTPKDIVDRFTRGLPIQSESTAKAVYPETASHDSPDLSKLAQLSRQDKTDLARSGRVNMKPKPKDPLPDPNPKTE